MAHTDDQGRRDRVLDLSCDLSGRFAARLLARQGFDVTRVEVLHPAARPSMIAGGETLLAGAPMDRFVDRGKGRLTLDLSTEEGSAALRDLIHSSGTVITTFPADAAAAMSLDAPTLGRQHPSTTVVSLTPYGRASSRADQTATEHILFAECGGMLITGSPTAAPFSPNMPIASLLGGIHGAIAVMLGSLGAAGEQTSAFHEIDVSLLEVLVANSERILSYLSYLEVLPYRGVGSGRPEQSSGGGAMRAADGFFYVFSGYQWFDKVAHMVGKPELTEQHDGDAGVDRREQAQAIDQIVRGAVADLKVDELARRAMELRMPSGPVNTMATLLDDPQLRSRQALPVLADGDLDIEDPWRMEPAPARAQSTREAEAAPLAAPRGALPLSGVRVLDLTHAFAGPTTTRILAEAGAEVIKIESTTRLDLLARGMLPFANDTSGEWWERSAYYGERNLGKQGLALDLSVEDGRELFLRLVRRSDVLVVNFSPGVLRKWGLGDAVLRQVNPELVVCAMTGFGLTGPKSDSPALAGTMEAASGFSAICRPDDDALPASLGFNFGDMVSGVYGALAVLGGLRQRARTGRGVTIDFSCAEAPLAFVAPHLLSCWETGEEPSVARDFVTAGEHVLVEATSPDGRQAWVLVHVPPGGRPDLDRRLAPGVQGTGADATSGGSVPHVRCSWSRDVVLQALDGAFCASVLSDAEDLWSHRVLRERDLFLFAHRPGVDTLPYARSVPGLFDGAALGPRMRSIPRLGSSNWEVLSRLTDVDPAGFAGLESAGVIGTRPTGRLPKTFQVPLALDDLEMAGLLHKVPGARKELIASFADQGPRCP